MPIATVAMPVPSSDSAQRRGASRYNEERTMKLLTYNDACGIARSFTSNDKPVAVLARRGVALHAVTALRQHHALHHGSTLLADLPAAQRDSILRKVDAARHCYWHRADIGGWLAFSAPSFNDDGKSSYPASRASGGSRSNALATGRLGGRNIYRAW